MKLQLFTALIILGLVTSPPAQAQQDAAQQEDAAQQDVREELTEAIESWSEAESRTFVGTVNEPKLDALNGLGGVVIISARTGGEAPLFDGEFEVVLSQQGDFGLVSVRELPGLSIYDNGDDIVNSITYREGAFSITNLASDLRQLLDAQNLAKYIARAEDVKKTTGLSGVDLYSCTLSARAIRANNEDQDSVPMRALTTASKVESIQAVIGVKDGVVSSMKFNVTRANPLAALMQRGGVNLKVKGGALPEGMDLNDAMKRQMQDPVVVYELIAIETPAKRTVEQMELLRRTSSAN